MSKLRITEAQINQKDFTVKSDLKTYGDQLLQTRTHYDKLGRVYLTQQSDGVALTNNTDNFTSPITGYHASNLSIVSSSRL